MMENDINSFERGVFSISMPEISSSRRSLNYKDHSRHQFMNDEIEKMLQIQTKRLSNIILNKQHSLHKSEAKLKKGKQLKNS
mmetsp:Transcript_22681/g.21862  ORF Transcript_22681/g.21862 Transcript_22681/m.21862 type:complete len:82 (+) Transcript_22681:535-780(+)